MENVLLLEHFMTASDLGMGMEEEEGLTNVQLILKKGSLVTADYVVIVVYFLVVISAGIASSYLSKRSSIRGYFLASRSVGCLAGLPGLAFSRPNKQIWPFFKLASLEIFENLLSSWPFF